MKKSSMQRLAVQRVLQANMLKYMQGIFGSAVDTRKIQEIQKYLLDGDFLWDVSSCISGVNTDYKANSTDEFMGWGETIRSNDWYTPDEAEEIYFNAPDSYNVKLSGSLDTACIAKNLAGTIGVPVSDLADIVEGPDFAKLVVDVLMNIAKNYEPDFLEAFEDLVVELEDDWTSEAGQDFQEIEFHVVNLSVKSGKSKTSGSQISFDMLLQLDVEVDNISVAPFEPDWD